VFRGFATTASAFRDFLAHEGLAARIQTLLDKLNTDDVTALSQAGTQIRKWIINTPCLQCLESEIAPPTSA
jgi:pyruvate,water dikinase